MENGLWESWKGERFADLGQEHKYRKKKPTKMVLKCLPRRSAFTWQSLGLTSEKLTAGVKMEERDLK